jgi:hypothetical protein
MATDGVLDSGLGGDAVEGSDDLLADLPDWLTLLLIYREAARPLLREQRDQILGFELVHR